MKLYFVSRMEYGQFKTVVLQVGLLLAPTLFLDSYSAGSFPLSCVGLSASSIPGKMTFLTLSLL